MWTLPDAGRDLVPAWAAQLADITSFPEGGFTTGIVGMAADLKWWTTDGIGGARGSQVRPSPVEPP